MFRVDTPLRSIRGWIICSLFILADTEDKKVVIIIAVIVGTITITICAIFSWRWTVKRGGNMLVTVSLIIDLIARAIANCSFSYRLFQISNEGKKDDATARRTASIH